MCPVQDRKRDEVERFIHNCFQNAYGADVRHFMPALMSLRNDEGALLGALGLRAARDEQLFLEQYLDRPVEQVLSSHINRPIDRDGIVEVGNLAVAAAGGGRWLITALTAYLQASHGKWVVFTVGPVLCNAFRRMGMRPIELGVADPARLSADEYASWGSYYEQEPRVMAGRVEYGFHILQRLLEAESTLGRLWLHAGQVGSMAA
jgi:hypothetical protein